MTPDERLQHHLGEAWLAALDCDAETWHENPYSHIVHLIGQRFDELGLADRLGEKLRLR